MSVVTARGNIIPRRHAYAGTTGKDGVVVLKDAPAGNYEVRV